MRTVTQALGCPLPDEPGRSDSVEGDILALKLQVTQGANTLTSSQIHPSTVLLSDDLLCFPDLVLVAKYAAFLDTVADMPTLNLQARAAEATYERQYVIACAYSRSLGSGAIATWDSIDDLRQCIRPNAFLGSHHNPAHTIQSDELVRCVLAISGECLHILNSMLGELPEILKISARHTA